MRRRRLWTVVLLLLVGFFVMPGSAVADGPCDLSPDLTPEVVGSSVDGLLQPPATEGTPATTNYNRFGMAGQFWHTHELGCSDIAAVFGNSWANTIFLWAKSIDKLTISTYQAAASEGPLQSIKDVVDDIVKNLSDALYWPYLTPIILLAAIWLAWYGLLRKRASVSVEGVVWMVLAVTVATWFFARPQDFTGLGKLVTDKTGEVINSAFSGLPGAQGTDCLPAPGGGTTFGNTGATGVDQNANALWSTLVCKPWLMGQFGTSDPQQPVVRDFGLKMLEIQTIEPAELGQPSNSSAHQAAYVGIVDPLKSDPRFQIVQGKDWTNRLGVAIGALLAALVAGLLIFLVAVSLLVLKVGFLLLLILGPVFLLIGVHPGSGRIIAMRWVEMLVGTLLRQAVLALVLSVLVYGYALIMSTTMSWGLQILFMALLTIAVFFYRRPFQHLFSSMSGHTITTRMLGEAASSSVLERSAVALPPVAASRVGKWGLRKAEPIIAATATGGAAGVAAAAAASTAQGRARGEEGATPSGTRIPAAAAPLNPEQAGKAGTRPAAATRSGSAPPLNLSGAPTRSTTGGPRLGAPGSSGPGSSGPGAAGPGTAGGSRPSGGSRVSSGSGGSSGSSSGSGGGWFSGRAGGWASRSGGSSRSSGSRGSGGLFGGGSRSSGGGSRSSGGRSSGGGLFGGGSRSSGNTRPPERASSGGSIFGGSRNADVPRARSSEPPPLWLHGREGGGRGGEEPPVPFWLKPNKPEKE